jgi:hypothetical protein
MAMVTQCKNSIIRGDSVTIHQMYEHLIPCKNVMIPEEHRYNLSNPHSLRCFKMKFQRGDDHKKLYDLPRVRCKQQALEGYLYCKHHGGKKNMLTVRKDGGIQMSQTAEIYRNVYDSEMGNMLEAFLNDPKMLDLKPELANLRLIMNNYIKKLLQKPKAHGINDAMNRFREVMINEEYTEETKYNKIVEIVESMTTITNGRAIDRIARCIDAVGRTMDRIYKYETSREYVLTPEGLKILLRAIVDLLDGSIKDEDLKEKIKEELLGLSVKTSGDISKYQAVRDKEKIVDAEVIAQD